MAFRSVALILTCLVLARIAKSQSSTVTDPPGLHLYIRLEGGKTAYKLGEPI
jgi:hypothetical protein